MRCCGHGTGACGCCPPLRSDTAGRAAQVLLLQLQRVQWLPSGQQVKDFSRVAFPELLPLAALTETATPLSARRAAPHDGAAPAGMAAVRQHTSPCSPPSASAAHCPLPGTVSQMPTSPASAADDVAARDELQTGIPPMYRLSAVVVHHGGSSSGHYSTYRAVRRGGGEGGCGQVACEWFEVSDAAVSRSDLEEVLGAEATMLVYELLHGL